MRRYSNVAIVYAETGLSADNTLGIRRQLMSIHCMIQRN